MAHAHRIPSAFLEGATQAIAVGCQSVKQRVEKKDKDCTPYCTAFTVRYSTTVDQERDRERGREKGAHHFWSHFFCLFPFFLLSYLFSIAPGLVDLRGPCLSDSALNRFGRYQFLLGVISYHSAVGTWCLSQPRRIR